MKFVRFEVLEVVSTKTAVLRYITPCNPVDMYRYFVDNCHFKIQTPYITYNMNPEYIIFPKYTYEMYFLRPLRILCLTIRSVCAEKRKERKILSYRFFRASSTVKALQEEKLVAAGLLLSG